MDMFEEGGLKDQGDTIDPISGNDVPIGSTKEEVRDDIPAQLSEGEFVLPADVVRFHGLEKIMALRDEAKVGLSKMEDMGQMGNSEEATIPDDTPFSMEDLDMEDEEEYNSEETKEPAMAQGGLAYAPGGLSTNTNTLGSQTSQFANTASRTQPKTYVPPPLPTAAPIGGFKYGTNTGKAEGKATFDKLIGGVAADEYRTYVNDAGAEIQVPFKNGQMLTGYVLPEGYRPKAKKVDSATLKSTKVKSTRPVQTNDNDNGGPSLTDQGFREGSTVRSFGTGTNNVGVTVNLPNGKGGFMGLVDLLLKPGALGKAFMDAITGTYDKGTTFGFTLKGDPNLSRNFSIKEYKDFQKLSPEEQDTFLDDKITKTRTIQDDEGPRRNSIMTDKRIDSKLTADKEFMDDISKISSRAKTEERLNKGPTPSDGDDAPDLTTQDARDNTYASQQQQNEAGDSGFSETTSSGESFGESGYGQGQGSYGGMGDFNMGGLAGKKKKKKMKRGGLASRK